MLRSADPPVEIPAEEDLQNTLCLRTPAAALQFNNFDLQLPLHSNEPSEHDQVAQQEQQHTTHTDHLRAAHHPSQVGVHVDRPKLRLLGTDKVKGSAHHYFIVPERGDTWCEWKAHNERVGRHDRVRCGKKGNYVLL